MQTVDRDFFPVGAGQTVLDLGCGEGRHVMAFALDGAVNAIGVDLSLDDLRTAQGRYARFTGADGAEPRPLALLAANALQLPFADGSFDAIVCSEVLEHIPDYRATIDEIDRIIKPGGYLCVSVPRAWCERICWTLSRDYHQVPGGHLRIFNARELQEEVAARGFEPYHRHGAHALHSPYWWLQCLFWKNRERNWLVRQYHRLLVWDMMDRPAFTQTLERLLNPVLGKSIVMYFRKPVA